MRLPPGVGLIALLFNVGLVALLFTVGLSHSLLEEQSDPAPGCRGYIPVMQTQSAGCSLRAQAYEGSLCASHENQRTWERLTSSYAGRFSSAANGSVVGVDITVLVVSHSIADNANHPILSQGSLIRIPQEFLLSE